MRKSPENQKVSTCIPSRLLQIKPKAHPKKSSGVWPLPLSFSTPLSQPTILTNTHSLSYKHTYLSLARSSCDNRKKMCSRHNRRHTFQRCHGPDFCQQQPFFQSCKPCDSQPGFSISSTGLPTLNHRGNYLNRVNDIANFLKIKLNKFIHVLHSICSILGL